MNGLNGVSGENDGNTVHHRKGHKNQVHEAHRNQHDNCSTHTPPGGQIYFTGFVQDWLGVRISHPTRVFIYLVTAAKFEKLPRTEKRPTLVE